MQLLLFLIEAIVSDSVSKKIPYLMSIGSYVYMYYEFWLIISNVLPIFKQSI